MLLKHLELESSKFGGLLLFSVCFEKRCASYNIDAMSLLHSALHAIHHLISQDGCLQVVVASYAEDEIQNRYYLTPFPVKAAHDFPGRFAFP